MNRLSKYILFKKPILFGFTVFLLALILTQFLTYQRYLILKSKAHQEVVNQANWIEKEFDKILNQSLTTTQTLAFIVENYGIPENFDSIAKLLLQTNKQLNVIELVDSTGVITHVYPLEGNELLGFNILEDSIAKKGANITLNRKDYFVTGPIRLHQGGDGFVSRVPIFKDNSFKGFSAAVIKLPQLLNALNIDDSSDNRFSYQLSKINIDKSEEFFFSSKQSATKDAYNVSIATRNGEWKLNVISNNTNKNFSAASVFGLLGIILSIIAGVFAWYLIIQPTRLDKMVKQKTLLLQESEQEIKEAKQKMEAAIRIGKIGYWSWDVQKDAVEWSNRMYAIYNVDPGTSLKYNTVVNTIHPDDRAFHEKTVQKCFKDKESSSFTYRILHKDNSIHHVLVELEVIENELGEAILLQGTVLDITDRVKAQEELDESQEKFYKSFHSNLTGKVIVDKNRTILEANETIAHILETTRENLIGKTLLDANVLDYSLHGQSEKRQVLWNKLLDIGILQDEELTYTLKSGKQIPALISIEPLKLENKTHFLVSAIDNSKRKEAESKLEMQNLELIKTNSELDRFVYSASHELRAPLASVLGLIDIILSEEKEEGLVFKLDMMKQSVQRLDSFIKDIVQFSQNKHVEIIKEKIDFRSLVQHSLESLLYLENRSKINVQITVSDELDFYSDKKRISVLLNNLISNAIKYHNIENKNPVIHIIINTFENNSEITISDNGLGIPEEHLNKIFDMFYRVSSKVMGTGLGLYVVKEIIEKLNGNITVESKESEGATFKIILPNRKDKLHKNQVIAK